MPRQYHSPSSVALGEACMHAWALTYIDGFRDPSVEWADIESGKMRVLPRGALVTDPTTQCTPGQRSLALGTALHQVNEEYYSGGTPNWYGLPGRIAESGRHLLPAPGGSGAVQVEHEIGADGHPWGAPSGLDAACIAEGRPSRVLIVDGIRWAGFRDVTFIGIDAKERQRLAWYAEAMLADYKSTADIGRYAKTAAALERDLQCNLYALDLMVAHDWDAWSCRWVYYETKEVRRARPTDVVIRRADALELVQSKAELIMTLDNIERSCDAPRNPRACEDYGGRACHASRGGPCNARMSLGALMRPKRKVDTHMVIAKSTDDLMALFAKKRAEVSAVAEAPAVVVGAPTVVAEAPVPRKRGRPAGSPNKPKATPAAPPVVESTASPTGTDDDDASAPRIVATVTLGRQVSAILALQTDLAAAQAELDVALGAAEAAQAVIDAILVRIVEAAQG